MLSRRMIINFVLVALIILFTYVGNRFEVQPGYQSKPGITDIEAAAVKSIAIKTADTSISLKRVGGGWNLESPIHWPANNVNVERLLDIVNSRTESRIEAAEIDLAPLGLDFPRAMLRLDDTRILFGATNNIGERRYTMIGSTVFLLPDNHLPFITQGLTALVDRRLLPRGLGLVSLKLPGLHLQRNADNSWQSAEPGNFSAGQLAQLAGNWQGLEASQIKPYVAARTPRQKIQAALEDGRKLEFFLLSIEPEIVIANPQIDLQYHFSADLYYQLLAPGHDDDSA